MTFSAPQTLKDKWPLFVKYGATKRCVYQSMQDADYTPADGNIIKPVDSSHTLEIVFDEISNALVDGDTIRSIDKVAVFPTLDLPVSPKINDLIVDPSLNEWIVKDVIEDPVAAHYELRIRPIKS